MAFEASVMAKKGKRRPLLHHLQDRYPDYGKDELWAFIECRQVLVDGEICPDSRRLIDTESRIAFSFPTFVSRGGEKLEHALAHWGIDVSGLTMVDAGSSTGGFTDCLLQHDAHTVHAVDVGYNQLDYRLRNDDRVIVHERTNIMHVHKLNPQPHAAVADLSFRSITGAASHILALTTQKWMISLIKPQFELRRETEEFSGVITQEATLAEVLLAVFDALAVENVGIKAMIESPIQGRKGNREFLALLREDHERMGRTEFLEQIGRLLPGFQEFPEILSLD